MNIMKLAYDQALEEDAVMAAGDAAPIGDVSAPSAPVDTSIITSKGMSHDDILGKYDPEKGVFGNNDFNLPKNVLGKGGMLRRLGYPSKKLKGHKNPYIKNMTILSEKDIEEAIEFLSYSNTVNEAEISNKEIFAGLNKIRSMLSDPSYLDEFVAKHKVEIENYEKTHNGKDKKTFSTAWKCIKHALNKGFNFIKKHWFKILLLILVIAAILWFGQIEQGIAFGTKLFGKGYENGVVKAQDAIKKVIKSVAPAEFSTPSFDVFKKAKSWIPADPALYPDTDISVGLDSEGNVFQTVLKDGRNGYIFPNSSDPDTIYIPQT